MSQTCGYLSIDYTRLPGEHFKRMYIRSVGVKRCSRARAVMRRYRNDPRPCTIAGGNTCSRRYSDGWLCYAPTAGSFPLVQVCDRDGKRVRGYVRIAEGRREPRAAQASFLVPTNPSVSGFGDFREGIRPKETSALRRLFGAPTRVRREPGEHFSTCLLSWGSIGVTASFSNYPFGPSVNPCTGGYFHSARLTDSRWHTPGGIGPGDSEAAARRQARGRCSQPSCGARRSVILGFHRSACGPELFTGVVATFKRDRVASLVVHSHICD